MTETAKLTSKNQITLPSNVRKSLGVGAGDRIDFVPDNAGGFNLRVRKGVLSDLVGLFKDIRPVSGDEIQEMVENARQGMAEGSLNAGN